MNAGEEERSAVAGRSIEEAVEMVRHTDDAIEETTARAALDHVANDDGIVTPAAAEDALAEATKVVATPETRAELAAIALQDARDATEVFADLDTVAARVAEFESRLDGIRSRIDALGTELQALLERDPEEGDLFAIGREIGRVRTEANDLQRAADGLQVDLEDFEEWLADPSVRVEELEADLDALAETISEREAALDAIGAGERSGERDDARPPTADPGAAWGEAAIGHRVAGLLLADLRAELVDVQSMADRIDDTGGDETAADLAALEERLDALEQRLDAIGDRLDGLARPAWRERFDDQLAAVEDVLADAEPPVAWGELQVAFEDARV